MDKQNRVAQWLPLLFALTAAGCGGGGGDEAPTPPAGQPSMPSIGAAVNLDDNHQVGALFFPDGDTATGGQGATVQGVLCAAANETFHIHSHLSIFVNGDAKAIPANLGITSTCQYYMHTHDHSGKIHMEAPAAMDFTLGNLFAIWGQPLTSTNVAGVTNLPMVVYIYDATTITQFTGDPATIPMTSHRHIAIVLGTPVTQVPYFTWTAQ